jgi:hypothetical protein
MENWSSRRIRELSPEIALRGMAANKIGCARISMMVRSTSSKARPDTLVQDRTPGSPFSLATHGGSIHFGGNPDIEQTSLSGDLPMGVSDRVMEAWYHPPLHE